MSVYADTEEELRSERGFVKNGSTAKSKQWSRFCSLVAEEAQKCVTNISAWSAGIVESIRTGVRYVVMVEHKLGWHEAGTSSWWSLTAPPKKHHS